MAENSPLKDRLSEGIYKERPEDFDFLEHAHKVLLAKSPPSKFLRYREVYKIFGQTFCFTKEMSQRVINHMEMRMLITKRKHGIELYQMGYIEFDEGKHA